VFHQYENENQIIKENLHEPKNVTLIVTLDRERLGKVIYATTNCPIFGYSHKDILDKSVFELFANFNSKKKTHLTNHLEELCGKNTDAFLIHKDGHIIPSLIFAAPLPYFQLGYHYVIIVRPSIDFNEYLFLQNDGRIHFTTKGLR
jgi:PAS domain S-box-containing protein